VFLAIPHCACNPNLQLAWTYTFVATAAQRELLAILVVLVADWGDCKGSSHEPREQTHTVRVAAAGINSAIGKKLQKRCNTLLTAVQGVQALSQQQLLLCYAVLSGEQAG
jgi:hypothetical protein